MSVVTLRNLSPEAVRIIRKKAAERKTSINKVVAGIVEDGLGLTQPVSRELVHHDLDHLAGSWTKREADRFDRWLKRHRRIEPELWK